MELPDLAGWLPQTKLTPPQLRGDLVPRPQLLRAVQQAVAQHALTLVAAPAGYGKTTALAAFAHAPAPLAVLWLALEPQDDDPRLLLTGLVAAVRQRYPGGCPSAEVLLAHPTLAAERVAAALINELLALLAGPTVLVLDDLHLLCEPASYALLSYLVEHLPPQLRLVVATRHDPPLPLARWQARGQLAQLRLAALSFSPAETTALLNGQLGLGLTAAELALLQQHTEGWVAGLRLLAGSLGEGPGLDGRAELLPQLAEGNRAVTEVLLEEVLNRQEPAVRTFLLATSILEELSPEVCAAVSGREDAEALLEVLYRRNLFLVALRPGAGPSYRYHTLFAEFLRRELGRATSEEERRALHHLAAEAEPVAARAIQHALRAEAWGLAIERIEQAGGLLIRRGLRRMFAGWVAALPVALAAARPRLSYLRGVCAWHEGRAEEAYIYLQRAAQGFAAQGDLTAQGEALTDLAVAIFFHGDLERGLATIRQALELPLPPRSRLHGRFALFAVSAFTRRQHESSIEEVYEIIALADRIDDPEALTIVRLLQHPISAVFLDSLTVIEAFNRQTLAQVQEPISLARIATLANLAANSFMQGRAEEALELGRLAQEGSVQAGGYPYVDAPLTIVVAQVHISAGRYDEAEQELHRGLEELPRLPLADLELAAQLYVLGRLRWLRGDLAGMQAVAVRMQAAHAGELPIAPLCRALMDGLLALAAGRLDEAQAILTAVAEGEEAVGLLVLYGSAHPLLAHLALLRGRPAEALAALEPWLAACARYDTPGRVLLEGAYVRPLLELAVAHGLHAAFAGRTLALLPEARPAEAAAAALALPASGEALTPREVEVLRLLATGATNKAIADRLVIGTQTAKTHVARILGKLGAATRTEAVTRAIALGLIPPD